MAASGGVQGAPMDFTQLELVVPNVTLELQVGGVARWLRCRGGRAAANNAARALRGGL